MKRSIFVYSIAILTLVMLISCSSSTNIPTAPDDHPSEHQTSPEIAELQLLNDGLHLPESEIYEYNHRFTGVWTLHYDSEMNELTAVPNRELAHLNVKNFLDDFGFPPQFVLVDTDYITGVMDVEATIINPTALSLYDVRMIVYTDNLGVRLMNPDNWTMLWDIPGGAQINPFKAFAKKENKRQFGAFKSHTERLQVYYPAGFQPPQFAIDVSLGGNCKEPFMIKNFKQDTLDYTIGSDANVHVEVYDWQDDVNYVSLTCSSIIGSIPVQFYKNGAKWTGSLVNNTGALPGNYVGVITAKSSNSGSLALYDVVKITVSKTKVYSPQLVHQTYVLDNAQAVAVDYGWAYVGRGEDGITFVDVAIPEEAVAKYTNVCPAYDIALENGYGIFADGSGISIFKADDIPDGWIYYKSVGTSTSEAVAVQDGYAYVARGNNAWVLSCGVSVIDFDPPEGAHQVKFVPKLADYSKGIDVSGSYAYVAYFWLGLSILDISDPANAFECKTLSLTGYPSDVKYDDGYVYLTDIGVLSGFRIIKVDPVSEAHVVKEINTGYSQRVDVYDGYAYVTKLDSLVIIDVHEPESAEIHSTLSIPNAGDSCVHGDYLYIVGGDQLYVVRLYD